LNPPLAYVCVRARNAWGSSAALARCFWRLTKKIPAGPRGACQGGRGARAPQATRLFIRLDVDDQIVVTNVIANETALIIYQGRAISRSPRRLGSRRSLTEQNVD